MSETLSIIAFLVHAVLFAVALLFAFADPALLHCNTYVDILFVLLSSLLIHSGYQAGKSNG